MLVSGAEALLPAESTTEREAQGLDPPVWSTSLAGLRLRAVIRCGLGRSLLRVASAKFSFPLGSWDEERPLPSSEGFTAPCPCSRAGLSQGRGSSEHCWALQMYLPFHAETTKLWRPGDPVSHAALPKGRG